MLLTVTLNAAVDKTYTVQDFRLNFVNRPSDFRAVAGGKGINVARVLKELGGDPLATGVLGGHNGDFIEESLRRQGVATSFVRVAGESRVCIAVLDPLAQTQTELNEPGPDLLPGESAAVMGHCVGLLEHAQGVLLSGSLPPGCPVDIYARIIRAARRCGVPAALDASGLPLARGAEAGPDLLKCNGFEASALWDKPLETPEQAGAAVRGLCNPPIRAVVITMGSAGAVAVGQDGVWFSEPPPVQFVSAVGSGDAFLAAYWLAWQRGECTADCLRWGNAAGAANAATFGAGFCRRHEVERLAAQGAPRRLEGF